MRFSSGLFLQLSSILLAAAAAYALGALCSEWLHRWILTFPMPSMKSSSYQMVTSSPDGGRLREEFQAILELSAVDTSGGGSKAAAWRCVTNDILLGIHRTPCSSFPMVAFLFE